MSKNYCQRSGAEGHKVQVLHAQGAEQESEGDGPHQRRAADVGGDEDGTSPQAVDRDSRRKSEDQPRRNAQRGEQAHLERRSVQHEHRRELQRAHQRPERRDGLTGPQPHEVGVAPKAGGFGEESQYGCSARRIERTGWAESARPLVSMPLG